MHDVSLQLWGAFPIVTLVALAVGLGARRGDYAHGLLLAYVAWAALIWVAGNALGAFGELTAGPLRLFWLVAATSSTALAIAAWRRRARWQSPSWPGWMGVAAWGAVGALLGITLVTALAAPPVTVDVLSYHGPRQLMWLQQGSLAPFLTVNDRAIMMPPLAELIGLQFFALTGGDHWANVPQWLAYALLPAAIVAVMRSWGTSRWGVRAALLLVTTLPMAYQEASNGKNDLQEALWVCLVAWQVAEAWGHTGPVRRVSAAWAGTIVAMALLTKSTAFVFLPPLLVVGGIGWWRRDRRHFLSLCATTTAVALVLTSAFFLRNISWYGSPLGVHRAEDGGEQSNRAVTPAIVISNALRNASLHVAAPSQGWNDRIEAVVRGAHSLIGVSADDPRSTLWVTQFGLGYTPADETRCGAPAQFLLVLAALPVALLWPAARTVRWLAVVVIVMALLFCAVIKWQPWGARLQLSGFVLGCVLTGALLHYLRPSLQPVFALGIGVICIAAWLPSAEVSVRPLWTKPTLFAESREVNEYRCFPPLRERDDSLVRVLRESGAREIALSTIHDFSYPIMLKIRSAIPGAHFYGAPVPAPGALPDAVVALDLMKPMPLHHEFPGGVRYRLVGDFGGDGVYLPVERVRQLRWEPRLPPFAGWDQSESFALRVDPYPAPDRVFLWREMTAGTARVGFPGSGTPLWIRGIVRAESGVSERLSVAVNGTVVARLDLPAAGEWLPFEINVSSPAPRNELRFERSGSGPATVQFTRLVVDDRPAQGP